MNSAVSIWFSQLKQFLDKGCDEAQITFTPMNQVMVLWQFSGHGNLTQGHMDIHIVKRFLLALVDREGKIWLNDFVAKYFDSESNKRDVMRKDEQERARKVRDTATMHEKNMSMQILLSDHPRFLSVSWEKLILLKDKFCLLIACFNYSHHLSRNVHWPSDPFSSPHEKTEGSGDIGFLN